MKHIIRPMGLLQISGESRLDLINRMSTNEVSLLKPGQGAATVLTTDIGRIIDRLIIYADESSAIAMAGENNGDNIGRYLMRFVFFNDDFVIHPITNNFSTIFVYGDDAARNLGEICGVELALAPHAWIKISINNIELTLHATDPLDSSGFVLIVPKESQDEVISAIQAAGSQEISEEEFDGMRIDALLPRLRHEMTGDYIPLETGLWDDVSFTKGCYTGQEIIARMDSRGKIARKLVQLDVDLQNGSPLAVGAAITAAGKPAGTITTAVGNRALGYVKSSLLEKEIPLEVEGNPVRPILSPL